MSKSNNEMPALIVALIVTALLIGGGGWWLQKRGFIGGGSNSAETSPASTTASNSNGAQSVASFGDVDNVPQGTFAYGGSTTWAPLRGAVDPLIQSAVPSFQLVYKDASSSSAGIQLLTDGELDFAQSSRPLNSTEKRRAQQAGIELQEIPVALEAVAIATHLDLNIPGVTLAQLKGIYTGNITNWQEVGGPNLPIEPTSRSADGGTVQYFQEDVLDGDAFSSDLRTLGTTTEALRFVSNTPGSIYFASAPEVVGQCTIAPLPVGESAQQIIPPYRQPYVNPSDCPARRNQLNLEAFQSQTYPLLRPLYVALRKDDAVSAQAGTAYVNMLKTQEGQALLLQAGFVPLP
ncbi:MAG: PstS family phosphate ABC transporter substrate-binding protein [Cyanobacteria bacterium P01_F01_bin.3]